jgi:membrane-bound serine protease (ClpP class)
MTWRPGARWFLLLFTLLFLLSSTAFGTQPAPATAEFVPDKVVHVIEIEGGIDDGLPHYVKRAVLEANQAGVDAIVVRIDTFGGFVSAAMEVRDALLLSEVKTIAYVDNRAISAGALIALACDRIVVGPGATIGAATPYYLDEYGSAHVTEKMVSSLRATFKATAEEKGHRTVLAEAMVDPDVYIPQVVDSGKLLTLSARQALNQELAHREAGSLAELLRVEKLKPAELVEVSPTPLERLSGALGISYLSGLLIALGLLALVVAIKVPGTGILEVLVVLAFGLFLFGKAMSGLAGFEEILLIVLGLGLLALEIFVIPGTTVTGVLGALFLMAGVVMSFVGQPLDSPFFVDELKQGVTVLGIALAGTGVLATGTFLVLRRTKAWKRMFLQTGEGQVETLLLETDRDALDGSWLGRTGETTSTLRPEGEVAVGTMKVPARAASGFIDAGTPVRVVAVEGRKILVEPATPATTGGIHG